MARLTPFPDRFQTWSNVHGRATCLDRRTDARPPTRCAACGRVERNVEDLAIMPPRGPGRLPTLPLAERFDANPTEIRRFLSDRPGPVRTAELGAVLRDAGIPT